MSDTRDAVSEALALNRRLAATLLVQKQELEAALAAGPGDQRAASLAAELADVERSYRSALAEIDELRRLGANVGAIDARAVVAGVLDRDPLLPSNEDRALDAARAHIAQLGAEAELGPGATATEDAPAEPPSREDADAQARLEFEALRARRQGTSAASGTEAAPTPPSAPKPPKKTM